ncbi:uncharacterized protein LOC127256845 [Andrographis paniculata]|uniref:uncharacterized protein LOC127256845 n=1 Tax=Andrographis paniculata TaxID=175694 RepID=UPI0021E955A0|nr:uncharacterized protein LOC127256845 [Andrographis paniculata]
MWQMLGREQSQRLNYECNFWGDDQPVMDSESNDQQAKQDRLRTKWMPALDKIFADIVVDHIVQGNRQNNAFDKKTWNQIREEFNRQTNLNFNNNQLRKHLDVLRTRYHHLQSSYNQNEPIQDPSCYMGFDLWEDIGAQSKNDPAKGKECPIYQQLCTIFASDAGADGKYAQSSHYGELYKSPGITGIGPSTTADGASPLPETPSTSKLPDGNIFSPRSTGKNMIDKKRKRPLEASPEQGNNWDQEIGAPMVEAMLDMINSSKLKGLTNSMFDERFSISNCIKALDEIPGIEDNVYYAALDMFEAPSFRETFISLNGNQVRQMWLQGKCRGRGLFIN